MNLLQTARELERYSLLAMDGEIGSVETFCFDGMVWVIRYPVVNASGWFTGRHVLISTVSIDEVEEAQRTN